MEMEQDTRIPIILERPFLAIMRAMIDVKNDKWSLQVRDEKVEFHLPRTMATSTLDGTCYRVDLLENILSKEAMTCHSMEDPLNVVLIGGDVIGTHKGKRGVYKAP